jgi:hypothetical protein
MKTRSIEVTTASVITQSSNSRQQIIKDLLPVFKQNQTTRFSEPTLLLSKHSDIFRSFDISPENEKESIVHYLSVTWEIQEECTHTEFLHKWGPDTQSANLHVDLEGFYSINVTSSTFYPENATRVTGYRTNIAIHSQHLVKHLIIGIEPAQFNTVLLFHFFADWKHDLAFYHLYFLSKIQSLFSHIIISCSHRNLTSDRHVAEQRIREVLDSSKLTIHHQRNHHKLGESTSFRTLFSHIYHGPHSYDFIFYAHSKGLRHTHYDAILYWVTAMYFQNISNFDDLVYSQSNMGGCFISKMAFDLTNRYPWHYCGSFYWIATRELPREHLASLLSSHHDYYVSEKFPSRIFPCMNACMEFTHIRVPIKSQVCPFYHSSFLQGHFPYLSNIIQTITEKIDFEFSCKNPL